jgi:ATP-dependent Lon protease
MDNINDKNDNKKRNILENSTNSNKKSKSNNIINLTINLADKQDVEEISDSDSSSSSSSESDTDEISIKFNDLLNNFIEIDSEVKKYFSNLSTKKQKHIINNIKKLNDYQNEDIPMIFRILDLPLKIDQKNHILKTYISLLSSKHQDIKLKTWFDSLMTIPFGKYIGIELESIKLLDIKKFLDKLKNNMDNAVYGHNDAKKQIIQIMGQQIRNSKAKGTILGIWGVAGCGKTQLIKEGIAKAMNRPFVFISLGGATNASFLEGHSYTYEGSLYGRIVNGLITSKCMNPIIYFDELDKISNTPRGDEISNILIHLTDPIQNTQFRDKYFHGIDIDLSRVTIIFSYNNPANINPILLDRITTIQTKYLLMPQKIHIALNYLLPDIIKDIGLNKNDIIINEEIIKYIIISYTHEGGIRDLKSILYNIAREINLSNLLKTIEIPFTVTLNYIKQILKHKKINEPEKIHLYDKIGVVNGLYASSLGTGGILPIQGLWYPSNKIMLLKMTGNLQQIIKESIDIANSLAWSLISEDIKKYYLAIWKNNPMGIHIHCSDGSVLKNGPSAGVALTILFYSLFMEKKIKHNIALTGEINLQGDITEIGGLDEKLEGAKKAGVKIVFIPKQNTKTLNNIKERNPKLIDDNFKVIAVSKINDLLDQVFY